MPTQIPGIGGVATTFTDPGGHTVVVTLVGDPTLQVGGDVLTVDSLASCDVEVTVPSFIALKTLVNGSPVVFDGAPLALISAPAFVATLSAPATKAFFT